MYVGGIIYFAANSAFASISAFLPTIITTFGFSTPLNSLSEDQLMIHALLANALAQLLTIPPYVVSTVVLLASCYASDKLRVRGVFVAGTSALAALGYMCVLTLAFIYGNREFVSFDRIQACSWWSHSTTTFDISPPSASRVARLA